jgi:D-amino-acid dehydrogenase
MQQQAVPVDFWSAQACAAAAPQLSPSIQGGLFFPRTGHFIDLYQVVGALFDAAQAAGVRFARRR